MKKKIALLENLSEEQRRAIKKLAPDYQIVNNLKEENLKDIKIIFSWKKELENLIAADKLQVEWIQHIYAGVNHLPIDLLQEKEIQLTTGSGTNAQAVAESTMSMILSITRQIVKSVREQENRNWFVPKKAYELKEKEILIVGAGKIGEQIGKLAKAFLMKTIGINRSGKKIKYMDKQYTQTDLSEIINQADIVVNVLPLTEETKGFFNHLLFSRMKKDVIFVNVGRGETVVTNDLLKALEYKEIAWAALDVFEKEPLDSSHPLWGYDNVLITPHIAGKVESQLDYIFPIFLDNLAAYLNNKEFPYNKVDLERGY